MKKRMIVVGGGAAGLMAAGRAAESGADVLLLEKNDRVGKKIFITGKGRCNITNSTDIEGIIENTPGNGSFLYSALYTFSNHDLVDFLHSYGLETKVERGGRIFPVSDKSIDVVNTLLKYTDRYGVKIMLKAPVDRIMTADGRAAGVLLKDGTELEGDSVIIATGGASYPGTGSTGDGYYMAKSLGHTVTDLKPSLIPLIIREEWIRELQGLSLRNVSIKLFNRKGKKIYEDFGEMLFTHYGVSGPIILSASRHVLSYGYKDITLSIDLKPALTEEKLDERVQRDFEKYSRKHYGNALDDLLPQKLIPVIIKLSGIPEEKPVNQITREERHGLVKLLKNLQMEIIGCRPLKEAIVTSGGVNVKEIDSSTMESRIVKGLYFAGEVIDVDAYTGGFNMTIAFSTGYLAGMNAAQ